MSPAEIKIIVKVKKIKSICKKYHIYKIKIGTFSFIWLITPNGIYSADKKKSFPYIEFKRAAI